MPIDVWRHFGIKKYILLLFNDIIAYTYLVKVLAIILLLTIPAISYAQLDKDVLYEMLNNYREHWKRKTLTPDSSLESYAQASAERIAITGKLVHVKTIPDDADSEILARVGNPDPEARAVTGWGKSKRHNEIMLVKKYRYFGIGYYESEDGYIWIAAYFR